MLDLNLILAFILLLCSQWKGEVPVGLKGTLLCIWRSLIMVNSNHTGWSEDEKRHLGEELSDVLIYLVRLSQQCHVDLPLAVLQKIEKNGLKYPADKVQGSSVKYTNYQDQNNA